MRALYAGDDLHGNNNLVGIVDEQGKRIFKKRLPNDPQTVLEALHPFKKNKVGTLVQIQLTLFEKTGLDGNMIPLRLRNLPKLHLNQHVFRGI